MSEKLWTAQLDRASLAAWLAPPRQVRFAIVEKLTAMEFPSMDETIELEERSGGRIFDEEYELRWKVEPDQYRVWYSGEQDPGAGFNQLPLPDIPPEEQKFSLWGPAEMRLAQAPEYPALGSQPGRTWLNGKIWKNDEGKVVYYRFTKMERTP